MAAKAVTQGSMTQRNVQISTNFHTRAHSLRGSQYYMDSADPTPAPAPSAAPDSCEAMKPAVSERWRMRVAARCRARRTGSAPAIPTCAGEPLRRRGITAKPSTSGLPCVHAQKPMGRQVAGAPHLQNAVGALADGFTAAPEVHVSLQGGSLWRARRAPSRACAPGRAAGL